jgi:Holliday junction resolvasome RuvABC endonuclease subunit
MRIVAIDPGVGYCGLAYLEPGLQYLKLYYHDIINDDFDNMLAPILYFLSLNPFNRPVCVIEAPKVYEGSPVRTDNIVELAHWSGVFRGILYPYCCKTIMATPAEWKGQVPKDVHQERLKKQHPEIEKALIGIKKYKQEHAVDAAGLAYWYAERYK